MTGALVLFAKTPGLSPVKTRLAADIGRAKAEAFYRHALACIEELALDATQLSHNTLIPYWAVGEQEGLGNPLWKNLNALWTGEGDLGERLAHIYATLLQQHDHVILIGTDSPQLQPHALIEAHVFLATKTNAIIGPAADGGYYLFGGNMAYPKEMWLSVPYSTNTTCSIFIEKLKPYCAVTEMAHTFDVDTLDDLYKLKTHSYLLTRPKQIKLAEWLGENL